MERLIYKFACKTDDNFICVRITMAETMEAAEVKQQLLDLKDRMLALKEHL
jgi:hypothetical protein